MKNRLLKNEGKSEIMLLVKIEKPIFLLSTARSGSTPIYKIMELYLQSNFNMQGVEEILNPYYGDYHEKDGKIVWNGTTNQLGPGTYHAHLMERFALAKRHEGKIFMKVFPSAFREETFDWLKNNHQFVCNERLNLWEQTLSYLVSDASKHWYSETGLKADAKSLEGSMLSFRAIEKSIFHYFHLKNVLKPIATFTYEEMLTQEPRDLLIAKGFDGIFNQDELIQVQKQTHSPKLDLLKNAEEVKAWYRNSFMEQICPLDKSLV